MEQDLGADSKGVTGFLLSCIIVILSVERDCSPEKAKARVKAKREDSLLDFW